MTALAVILKNPFYIGIILIKRTGERFQGAHAPIIPTLVFRRVQEVMSGKRNGRTATHPFLFRRLVQCRRCGYSLIGERQKGRVYYRCHTVTCARTSIREDILEQETITVLRRLHFSDDEKREIAQQLAILNVDRIRSRQGETRRLALRRDQIGVQLNRLTDAFLEGALEKDELHERKNALLTERQLVNEQIAVTSSSDDVSTQLSEFLELAGNAYSAYKSGWQDEKRDLIQTITSNRWVDGKDVMFTLALPFEEVANRSTLQNGAPHRRTPRTVQGWVRKILALIQKGQIALPALRNIDDATRYAA